MITLKLKFLTGATEMGQWEKRLAVRTWQPEFDPRRPCEKSGVVSHICYPALLQVGSKGRRMGWKPIGKLAQS